MPAEGSEKSIPRQIVKVIIFTLASPFLCVGVSCYYGFVLVRSCVTGQPSCEYCGTGRMRRREAKKIKELMKKEAPKSLPAKRKRSLTLPLRRPALIGFRRQKTSGQIASTFFKLPLEIRNIIYAYALTDDTHPLHIFRRADRRLGHYRCKLIGSISNAHYQNAEYPTASQTMTGAWLPDPDKTLQSGWLPLLLTCRIV